MADGDGTKGVAEDTEHVMANVRGRIRAENKKEPAEDRVNVERAEVEEIGKGIKAQVIEGAVAGVLDEVGGLEGGDPSVDETFFAGEGRGGEDVVVRGDPFVETAVAVDFIKAGVVVAQVFVAVDGHVKGVLNRYWLGSKSFGQ